MKGNDNPRGTGGLSGREHDVLALAAQGCTDKAIADQLHLSAHTLNTYWRRVSSKLGVRSRAAPIAKILNAHSVT